MPPFRILIAFSGIRKPLVGTDYNRRVEECTRAAATLLRAARRAGAEVKLGGLTDAEYQGHRHLLAGSEAKRAAHFFSERARVAQGVRTWVAGDVEAFGRLMTASGQSSIDNYECGSPPLIDLYQILVRTPGVYGARFSGAGFRGCCVTLVAAESAAEAAERVQRAYAAAHPELAADAYTLLCDSDDGARHL
jgi:galacturonokinase